MSGAGDPARSPVHQALAARLAGDGSVGVPIVVEHRWDRRVSVEVERNSNGYRWHIDVAAEDAETVQALVDHLDTWLAERFDE